MSDELDRLLIIEFNDLPDDARQWLLDEVHANNFDTIEIVNIAGRHDESDDEYIDRVARAAPPHPDRLCDCGHAYVFHCTPTGRCLVDPDTCACDDFRPSTFPITEACEP